MLSGYNVIGMAWRKAMHFDFINEFFLMTVAIIGAFSIGLYSEGGAVMVFTPMVKWFQDVTIDRAKRSIKALLDIRQDKVIFRRNAFGTELVYILLSNITL